MTAALDLRRPARILVGLVAAAALVAAVVAMLCAPGVRALLGFGFGGTARSLGEAARVFADNLKLAAGVMLAGLVVGLGDGEDPSRLIDGWMRGVRLVCDLAVGLAVACNVVLVGAALGAYGWRMVAVVIPHGPVEVSAYAIALDVYARARRGRLRSRVWLAAAAAIVALLAVAALLETFAGLR